MPEDQGDQPEIPNNTGSGPEGEAISPVPADDQTTTTPPVAETKRSKVVGVDDYLKRLEEAKAPAPAEEPKQGEPAEEPNEPAEATENTESEELGTEEQPPEAEATPEQPKKEFRPRLSSLDERQQEAILLVKTLKEKGEGISLSEAEKRVNLKYGIDDSKPVTPAEPVRTIEQIRAEIEAKEAESDKAADEIDIKAVNKLNREIRKLEDEIRQTEAKQKQIEQAQETAEDAAFDLQVSASAEQAAELYECMKDPNHEIHARAKEFFDALEASGNPLANQSNAPLKVYQMAANDLGIPPRIRSQKPKNGSSPSTTPKPQPVSQRAVGRPNAAVSPASGAARTTTPGLPALPLGKRLNAQEYVDHLAKIGVRVA